MRAPFRSIETLRDHLTAADPAGIASAAIWLAGTVVIAAAGVTAIRYLAATPTQPWIGASALPPSDLLVAAGLLLLGGVAVRAAYLIATRSPRWAIALGFATLIGIRLVTLTAIDGWLVSDFAGYRSIATGMLEGYGFWTSVPPGYPLLEAAAIAVGGRTVLSGELLNLLLSMAAAAAVYLLASRGWGARAGAVALMTFALMPSQILNTVVLGTEIGYGASLAVVALVARHATGGRLFVAAACGAALGLSQYIRPTSQFLVPAFALLFLLFAATRRSWARAALVMTLAFAVTVMPIIAWNATTNGRWSVSPSLFDKWSIYMGLCVPCNGQFNGAVAADVAAAAGIRGSHNDDTPGERFSPTRLAEARARNDVAGDLLPALIRDNGLQSLLIQPAKFALMWQNADYPVRFVFGPSSPQPDPRAAAIAALVAQVAWVLALIAALGGLWRARRDRSSEVTVVLLILLVAVAVHVLAEVQPRYHEYFVPLVCVLAGAAVSRGRPRGVDGSAAAGPPAMPG